MGKRIAVILALVLCIGGVLAVSSYAAPAQILNDIGYCLNETNSHAVVTNSANGNVVFTCKGSLDNVSFPKAVRITDPLDCLLLLGSGASGQGVLTPNGDFSLVCHNKVL